MATTPSLPGLSIVLPCFDEAENIATAVAQAEAAAAACSVRFEIVVVDDGSTDATRQIATGLTERRADVRLIVHDRNLGYGAAVRSGIRAARMPYILLTDADLQFDLMQLHDFVAEVGTADLLVGYRATRMDPLMRRVDAALWNRLVHGVFRLPVRDVDCAFKLVPRDLVASLGLTSEGAVISTELVVKSMRAGATVRELPVRHRPRQAGRQTGADPHVIALALRELRELRHRLARSDTPAAPGTHAR